ncbi:Uncharacterised protein [Chlamydia trachomatis]|nr:Uncharacterised protein [Chlamydia trachomatis]
MFHVKHSLHQTTRHAEPAADSIPEHCVYRKHQQWGTDYVAPISTELNALSWHSNAFLRFPQGFLLAKQTWTPHSF